MNSKVSLAVIDQMEILSGLISAGHIHITSRVGYISSDLAVNLTKPLHADLLYFLSY